MGCVRTATYQPTGSFMMTTTARIYAHLYDDELDSVAAALDRIGGQQ